MRTVLSERSTIRRLKIEKALRGEALRRAVRGRQRGPGVLVFPELVQRTGYRCDACVSVDVGVGSQAVTVAG
jgi:hypothetical protein